ncbi:MAG TPA: DNA polymerase, partial [Acidobacteriota bacterium]|nr:DNA polymerase [Acidobacteriota bacterium]
KIEFDCVRAVAEMELAGISLNLDRWEALRKQISTVRDTLAIRLREAFGGGFLGEINLDSPTQVQRALAMRGIQVSGTSRWELARFSDHPEVRLFQEYRKASKLCSAFLDTLPKFIHPQTGRLHPVYEQCLVVSGRFSCHSPNLQQLPHDREFRACFIPAEGHSFVIADYSQIELRVAAQLSQDERMMDAYRANQDLHLLTASLITGKPMGSVTKADRQAAKAVNFGLLYGQGAQGLKSYAKQSYGVDLTLADAERFRDRFFLAYQGIATWHRQTARNQKKIRETRTLIGRRRLIEKPLELPTLLNLPVQGTAADITKLALAKILPQLAPFGAHIVGCIHDEILLETPTDCAQEVARLLSGAMEAAGNESLGEVPVIAEASIGQTWADKG